MTKVFSRPWRRLLSLLLVLALLAAMPPRGHADNDYEQDLRDQFSNAEEALKQIKEQIANTQQEQENNKSIREQQLGAQEQIAIQINTLNEQIEYVNALITEQKFKIEQKQKEIDQKQAEFDARWAGFKERMAAMQMLNEGGSIALLSSVTNLYELLTFTQAMDDIATRDNEICQELENERIELNNDKEELERVQAELEANEAALSENKEQLEAKKVELQGYIDALDGEIAQSAQELLDLESEKAEAEKQFQAAANALSAYLSSQNRKYNDPAIKCSLDFGVPLQTWKRTTTEFGQGGHLGLDIAAPASTPIYAVADGVVTAAGYHNHPYSYGNYVQIFHGTADDGNTYSTLYAHMIQTPSVSEGQSVVKGQLIGYVGNTGYSFGYHLHFELKINEVRQNPRLIFSP